jgi:membrane-bound serine protease (ClpP class)
VKRFLVLIALTALAAPALAAAAEPAPRVLAAKFDNDVNPVTRDYLVDAIEKANDEDFDAIVIQLDTPGGLSDSMNDIVKAELASKVAVIVYVSPDGARAASAGVWIGQAADILAMAPQTNIGSSTPISVGGEDIQKDLRRKVVNDAAASLRALAKSHGRNARWADLAVRQASNLTAGEALARGVIDEIAPSLPRLLEKIDGQKTVPKGIVLDTAGAQIEQIDMSGWKKVLDLLIDPNIIALMLSIGIIGIVVELWNPGLIFPGTVGGISLIMGLYGLQVLPTSAAGLLLLLLAFGFFVADLFVPSHGALTAAGAITFVIACLLLFDPAGPTYQVSLPVAIAIAATLGAFMLFAVAKIVQVRRSPVAVGLSDIIGRHGRVRGEGYVFVNGELWRARSDEPLRTGEEVEVTDVDGLTLGVRRIAS